LIGTIRFYDTLTVWYGPPEEQCARSLIAFLYAYASSQLIYPSLSSPMHLLHSYSTSFTPA